MDLGLLQKQVAEQIGVNALTICNWEGNKTAPVIRCIPAIIRFLGYNPFPPVQTMPEQLVTARKALGLSQKQLAKSLGIDESTVRSWEAERHRPTKKSSEILERFFVK